MRNRCRRFHCPLLVQFGVFRYAFLLIEIARPNLNQIGMCLNLIFLLPLTDEEMSSPVEVQLSIKCLNPPDRFRIIHLTQIPLSG
jgi:hypothetical protein